MKKQKQFLISLISFLAIVQVAHSQNNFVDLLQIAAFNEDDGIRVTWTSEGEFNSLYFTVERSVNFYDYDSIGFVQAAGISDTLITYSFMDENPPEVPCLYYKLKILYIDSTSQLTNPCDACKIVIIQKKNVLYPQPVTDVSYLLIDGVDRNEAAHVVISDATGRIVYEETIENPYHLTSLFFYCERNYFYGKGLYFLRVFNSKKEVYQTEILVI